MHNGYIPKITILQQNGVFTMNYTSFIPYIYDGNIKKEKDFRGTKDYIFVSYAHVDSERVFNIINILHRHGLRMWADKGIETSTNWHKSIMHALNHSSAFLCFLSHGVEMRSVIVDEINIALEKQNTDPNYKIVFVNIDRVSPDLFSYSGSYAITRKLNDFQCLNLYTSGIVGSSMCSLISALWESGSYRFARDGHVKPDSVTPLGSFQALDSTYIYERGNYSEDIETVRKQGCRRLSQTQIDKNAVYPICLDNQWIPPKLIGDQRFIQHGLLEIKKEIVEFQHYEISRALLHNWQLIINRAFVFNGDLISNYLSNTNEKTALAELMCNGSIVLYLYSETSPAQNPAFSCDQEKINLWSNFIDNIADKQGNDKFIFCLRFDWDDDINKYENSKMARNFEKFCLNTANDDYLLAELCNRFDIRGKEEQIEFKKRWEAVQDDFHIYKKATNKSYNREQLYIGFIIQNGEKVPSGIIKHSGPIGEMKSDEFSAEIKQIADYFYETNLPHLLGIRALVPPKTKSFSISEKIDSGRMVKVEELEYAVSEFKFTYDNNVKVLSTDTLTLAALTQIRKLDEWNIYMCSLTEARKRTRLSELDFYTVEDVYKKYQNLISALSDKKIVECRSENESPVLTIIYRIGLSKITTEYRSNNNIKIYEDRKINSELEGKRRVSLKITYLCGASLHSENASNGESCFLTEIEIFEGSTYESGLEFYNSLIKRLKILERVKERENSNEWIIFEELIKKKKAYFESIINSGTERNWHVELNILNVCEYEIENDLRDIIGVQGEEITLLAIENNERKIFKLKNEKVAY